MNSPHRVAARVRRLTSLTEKCPNTAHAISFGQAASPVTRRTFARQLSVALAATAFISNAAQPGLRLKAAVIGHTGRGDYGHGMDGIFQNREGIEVVAVADPNAEGRARIAAKIGAPRQYADYRELLAKERPRLISVAMRHADLHHDVIHAALNSGAHVYCEKPFTTTSAEADELLRVAANHGLKIAVAHTMRMMPVATRLKQALREGLIGELVEMRAFGKQDARVGGEDMMVLGSHLFDLMRMFAGDPLSCSARVLWMERTRHHAE
jgi:predicted dehydrogenase